MSISWTNPSVRRTPHALPDQWRERFFQNLAIMAAGPAVTLAIYVTNEGGIGDLTGLFHFAGIIFMLGIMTLIVSVLWSFGLWWIRKSIIASFSIVFVSVITSELLYLALLLGYSFYGLEDPVRAEMIMWLPVAIIFMIPFTLPMAILVSYGAAEIMSDLKKKPQATP